MSSNHGPHIRSSRRESRFIDASRRGLIASIVEPCTAGDHGDVFGQVQGGSNDDHGEEEEEERVEDEFLRRRQHVQREGDFVLVPLALEPAEER